MTTYTYSTRRIFGDYIRTGFGSALAAVPLSLPDLHAFFQVLFGTGFVLFIIFGISTVRRHITKVHVTERSISLRGMGSATLIWRDISSLKLAHFSTSRDGSNGWMQLSLTDDGQNIKIDSRLDGFQKIVRLAVNGAQVNDLSLDPATIDNLSALGVSSNVIGPSNVIGEGALA